MSSGLVGAAVAVVWRRKLKLKANFESGSSHFSFKRSDPGACNADFIGSTCTALPWLPRWKPRAGRSWSTACGWPQSCTHPCSRVSENYTFRP